VRRGKAGKDPASPRGYAVARKKMMERRGFRIDRRSGVDRRKIHDLNYFIIGGVERRKFKERRSREERRKNWIRVDEWISVFVDDPGILKRRESLRRKGARFFSLKWVQC